MSISTDYILEESYNKVFNLSASSSGFNPNLLEESKALFDIHTPSNTITPKFLNVNALLAGIEFSRKFQAFAVEIQNRIDKIIETDCRYWVLPENLGVEYIVTKWPNSISLTAEQENDILDLIASLRLQRFEFRIRGFQVNPDGCVVLRGYDDDNIVKTRNALRNSFGWIPARQSGWAHVPLGRILADLDKSCHRKLILECIKSFEVDVFNEPIEEVHYVHEMQWYMVTKSKLNTFCLL